MTRRVCLVAAAALLIVLLSAFSQAPLTLIHLDVGGLMAKGIWGLLALLGAGILYLSREALNTLKNLDGKVTTMTHELFGPNGTNGMRGDLKHTKRLVERHDRLLVLLADRAQVNFDGTEQEDDR